MFLYFNKLNQIGGGNHIHETASASYLNESKHMRAPLLASASHCWKKIIVLFALLALGCMWSVQSAQAVVIEIHITNAGPFEAWNPPEGDALAIFWGEPSQTYSPTWSVGSESTTVIYVDIGSNDPAEITRIEIWGYTWTDETMTDGTVTDGVGGWTGLYGTVEID